MEPNYLPNQGISRSKKAWIVLATVVLTAGIVGGGTYYYFNKKADNDLAVLQKQIDDLNTEKEALTNTAVATATTTAVADETADWKTYSESSTGFTLKYPASYKIVSSDNSIWSQTSPGDVSVYSFGVVPSTSETNGLGPDLFIIASSQTKKSGLADAIKAGSMTQVMALDPELDQTRVSIKKLGDNYFLRVFPGESGTAPNVAKSIWYYTVLGDKFVVIVTNVSLTQTEAAVFNNSLKADEEKLIIDTYGPIETLVSTLKQITQ